MGATEHWVVLWADISSVVFIFSIIFCGVNAIITLQYRMNYNNISSIYDNVGEFKEYDNTWVDGSTVQYFIDNYGEDLFVRVSTPSNPVGVYDRGLLNSKDLDSVNYVNPVDQFYCSLLRDSNNDVVGVNFEQNGVSLSNAETSDAIQKCEERLR